MKALLLSTALVLAPLTAAALDLSDMSPAEKEAFGAQVRAYLMENPQVLREVIEVLERRQNPQE